MGRTFFFYRVCVSFRLIVAFQVLPQFARCRSIFCLNFLDLFCSFFVIFSGFSSFHHFFFFFFSFFRLSHLLWSFKCGDFLYFQCCFVSFTFCYPLSFFQVFFCFVSIFMFSKKIICFIFIFRGDRLSNGFAQKGSSKSFLTKAPTPPWHHWEQSTLFSIFLAFSFYFMCIYVCVFIIYLSCFFTILYRFTIFLGFLYFFSCCFSLKL